jgi:hypothetical protein
MALLSAADRDTVRGRFSAITRPVTILFFTQTFAAPTRCGSQNRCWTR